MNFENFTLESRPISIASYSNYKEAVFLISVLDEPDGYGRIIPEDAGKKYHKTIIGFPIVAKLVKNVFGKPVDFGGHELVITKDKNGKKQSKFLTTAIGSVTDAWIEEREVEGYDEEKKCILIKCKLWVTRFPEYFKVFDKLWEDGKIQCSWELTATKVEKKDGFSIYKVFEFIGNAILGSQKTPAVQGAGVVEYAELDDDYDTKLAEALGKDIANLDIDYEEMEVTDLASKEKIETSVVDTEVNKNDVNTYVAETEENNITSETEVVKSIAETTEENIEEQPEQAEVAKPTEVSEESENTEIASLTNNDLYRRISDACRKKANADWGWISYWFPEEKTVWYKCGGDNKKTELDFKLFTYEVDENDEVTVSEPQDVKLTVSVAEINTVLAEKNKEVETLKAELELKDSSIIKAGQTIAELKVEVSELKPYKEAAEKAEQERIEAEIAEVKDSLRKTLLKNNLFSEEEIASPEISELIETRNESAIKTLIADKYIASFDKEENVEMTSVADVTSTSVASLEVDDIDESPSTFMKNMLRRK